MSDFKVTHYVDDLDPDLTITIQINGSHHAFNYEDGSPEAIAIQALINGDYTTEYMEGGE